jgi:hypothetical protein
LNIFPLWPDSIVGALQNLKLFKIGRSRDRNMRSLMNLRLKIILPIISAVLIILSIGNALTYNHTSENLQKIIRENMRGEAFFLT